MPNIKAYGSKARSGAEAAALERFLLGGEPPEAELLRRYKLAAYAYTRVGAEHALRGELERDFVLATAQHAAVRAEVRALVRAWQIAGVDVLVFKGFALAEFVYPEPAARFYSDVDLLMKPETSHEASRVAQDLGWLESWHEQKPSGVQGHRGPGQGEHELMHLDSRRVRLRLDVHRRILHNKLPWTRVQRRFTREAWAASGEQPWGETAVRLLHPADALLIGLVTNRAWSGDDWRLRPHDFLDFKLLIARGGLTQEGLLARARALGCRRTLELFLRRCDAFAGTLTLRAPGWVEKQRRNLAVVPERGHPSLEKTARLAMRAPGTLWDMLRESPGVVRLLARRDLETLAASPERVNALAPVTRPQPVSYEAWRSVQRGVRRDLALLGKAPGPGDPLLTLALFFALRKRGCPVTFCSGGKDGRAGAGCWLELDGEVLTLRGEAS